MKILRYLLFAGILIFSLNAKDILLPVSSIELGGNVISSFVDKNILYANTDNGLVEIYNLSDNEKIKTIILPKIDRGFGTAFIYPRVINTDVIDGGKRILILSEDSEAGRALYIYEDEKLIQLFSYKDRLNISKAYFVDKDKIILGLLSNEIILYDLNKKKFLYKVQPYWAMLTDFSLSADRTLAFSAAESGVVYVFDVKTGKNIKDFNLHTDIILSVKYANNTLITGGADKNVGVADFKSKKSYLLNTDFPVYAVAISPSGKVGAYVANEDNMVLVFDTKTKKIIAKFEGSKSNKNINTIIFLNEEEISVSSSSNKILRWKLP